MDCQEVRDLLSPYLDRELTEEETAAVAAHLEQCPRCMEHSTLFSQLSRVLKHWEGVRASVNARQHLTEKIRAASRSSTSRRTLPVVLLLLLAGALLAGTGAALVVWLLRRGTEAPAGPEAGPDRAAAECTAVAGEVEVVTGGIPVKLAGRRELRGGQELRCGLGGAAQLRLPELPAARLLLRGAARMTLGARTFTLDEGTLVFDLPAAADGARPRLLVRRWSVEPSADRTVGLVRISGDGSLKLAVLNGSARLCGEPGAAGIPVAAGSEVNLGVGGELQPPRQVTDLREFEFLGDDR